ncbi:hypothetical protein V493_02539 [Pseudogymnoascus sp. VKM F-4281 (FW-2241)]|nr:hypothetical protein V493_02539 [Pseudogymnoascus sp. VKM F-4281 (FW-2241)]
MAEKTKRQPFWLGGVAASMAACCTHPLDQTKYRMQVLSERKPMLHTLYMFASRNGIHSLWTGISASILRQSTYSTTRFGLYNYLTSVMKRSYGVRDLSAVSTIVCAGTAGGVAGMLGNPTEIVLVRMCADGAKAPVDRYGYAHALDGFVSIGREEGIKAFSKGLGPNIVRSVLMNRSVSTYYPSSLSGGAYGFSYTSAKAKLLSASWLKMNDGVMLHITASIAAGTVATTVCAPADVLKSRIQNAAAVGGKSAGLFHVVAESMREEGPRFLMKGWLPAWLRLTLANLSRLRHDSMSDIVMDKAGRSAKDEIRAVSDSYPHRSGSELAVDHNFAGHGRGADASNEMDERSESAEAASSSGSTKQAACLSCRRSKIRCYRGAGDPKCRRCNQANSECIIPKYHAGRQKGVKNKRTGLEKAVYRIGQAIARTKANSGELEDEQAAVNLQHLLSSTAGLLPRSTISQEPCQSPQMQAPTSMPTHHVITATTSLGYPTHNNVTASPGYPIHRSHNNNYSVDDAENPLQLLASASNMAVSPQPLANSQPPASSGPFYLAKEDEDKDLQTFFGPFSPNLDASEEIDPIDIGYITSSETIALFNFFYQNLSHTRWGLDPVVHTAEFVRSRSSFLFTSILAASALFLPSTAALSKRLSVHCKKLAYYVMEKRYRSPEIVLAFIINVPWMAPGKHWADDETCAYMAMALSVAMDLSLNKLIVPAPGFPQREIPNHVPKPDCITAKKALLLDGFNDVDPYSTWGQRLLRRRERIWLSLFVLDRGVCLARGRSFTVHITPLVETCDQWHISDMADTWDQSIVSSAVIRRDLVTLIADIKSTCDVVADGVSIVQVLKDIIEGFFNQWFSVWAGPVGSKHHVLPPYVEILVSHTRLSTYSSVINHPTAPVEVKRFFRAAGLSSALNVMRAAVQGEGRLKSMPNNTAIMISFAACFALSISTMAEGNTLSLVPSIRILVEEAADMLERIGRTPSHRNGTSSLFGQHLRKIIQNIFAAPGREVQVVAPPIGQDVSVGGYDTQNGQSLRGFADFQPVLFSAMSNDQVIAAVDSASQELDAWLSTFQMHDNAGLDWLNWMDC